MTLIKVRTYGSIQLTELQAVILALNVPANKWPNHFIYYKLLGHCPHQGKKTLGISCLRDIQNINQNHVSLHILRPRATLPGHTLFPLFPLEL